MNTLRAPLKRSRGYSLIEITVVTGVLGLLAVSMVSAFDGVQQARSQNMAQAQLQTAQQALRGFALRNKRLPCPDDVGNGWESPDCPPALQNGWLPYASLGLQQPVPGQRIRYGVYRNTAVADLARSSFQGMDIPDSSGLGGFSNALEKLTLAPASGNNPHYSNGSSALTSTACQSTDITNPAFLLVAPVMDLDGSGASGSPFDGPNLGFSGTSMCVAPPGRPATATYDDIVVAEGSSTLLGWLIEATR